MLTPGCAAATRVWTPGRPWPHPWGMLTVPGIISSLTSSGMGMLPTRDSTRTS